ncbi:hypothetical protein POTOM_030159 [Populus tomentosa]|uniref:Uncharacterized protein n=1 Tax=Populus tomentosa TaxID=118781 RepID=A0A8X7Z871_POPTO|nr:hypothetical protein POTOM_030159 [Populus tomentosa]
MGKKQKKAEAETDAERVENEKAENELELTNGDSHKKKKKKKNKERNESDKEVIKANEIPTVSVAISGSIINNAQSLELATRVLHPLYLLAGQIARAATIFRIDEVSIFIFTIDKIRVVVFDNKSSYEKEDRTLMTDNYSDENESGAAFFVRILRYLETPQYLRKALFPKHCNLRFVGMLPPLDAPHHLRKHEWAPFREGVTLNEKVPNSGETLVDVGLSKNVSINQVLEPGIRVTVAMGTNRNLDSDSPRQVVSLLKPREEAGMYWGYRVRYASNISSVFKDCPYKGGYDHLIGTSEHGLIINSSELSLPAFRHLLIAFGGLAGLEESIEEDSNLKGKNVREVFDSYLNTCPHQGSRTIRTEEAIFISLQYFQEPINRALHRVQL